MPMPTSSIGECVPEVTSPPPSIGMPCRGIAFSSITNATSLRSGPSSLIAAQHVDAREILGERALGRELVIDGPMRLSVLPMPRISAQRSISPMPPAPTGAQMIDVRWIGASPSWWALLRAGRDRTVTLYQPTIVLETDANGVPNWQFKPGAGASQPQGAPAEGFHLADRRAAGSCRAR